MLVDNPQLNSSPIAATNITAIVTDASGQAVSGKTITFSQGADSTAYLTNVSATTSANGVATATLNLGTDMTNRVITVSASADGVTTSSAITVSGTTISVTGNTSLSLSTQTALNVTVKDSTGTAVPNMLLTAVSQNGNPITLSPATGYTNASGQVTATVTANNAGAGTDILTFTGAGTTATVTLTINTASFIFSAPVTVAPATTPEIVVNTATPVSVTWTDGGVPVSGTVNFTTTRGTFVSSTAATDASGVATVTLQANSTGPATITAASSSGTPAATLSVVFVTTTADSITAQASPSTVAINPYGSTANQSVISVRVRDVNSNLVKNASVIFNQATDATGGVLSAGQATTDVTGSASVNYIAGTVSSANNGVVITATVTAVNGVAIVPVQATVKLTVASQSMFVRLGTDNKVYPGTPQQGASTKKYLALVTDSGGNNVPDGTEVRFTLRPTVTNAYFKGEYIWNGVDKWNRVVAATCASEDTNGNYLLDQALLEDINNNNFLDPYGVASVNATATTVSGYAVANISFPAQYGGWVQVILEARAGVVGNDPPTTSVYLLYNDVDEYTDVTVPPPGQFSPFGVGGVCTDTL